MKKWLTILLIALSSYALVACGGGKYKHDGIFTAFDVSESYGAPQITWVSVLVENGKVEQYFIDERQTEDGVWNEKTKKELGDDYNMRPASPIEKEWYEQAESIELFFLKHGVNKLKLDDEGYVDGLAGATMIADMYQDLANKALEKAEKGIYSAFEVSDNYGAVQLTWVDAHYNNKGEVIKYNIDELQSEDNTWNFHTKKELKEEYGMKPVSPIDKEWYEQAEVIEEFFLKNTPEDLTLDDEGYVDGLTGATMIASSYKSLAIKARDYNTSTTFDNGDLIINSDNENNDFVDEGVLVPENLNHNGLFTAFEVSESYGFPQITWVEVYVYNGVIHSYNIDELQSSEDGWNELTKKELKYDYNMKAASDIDKEWFEQAYEIEQAFLNQGLNSVQVDNEGYIDNMTGATMIADNYRRVAAKALDNASKGIYTALDFSISYGYPQVTWVDVEYENDEIKSYFIDELQSTKDGWNELTKKELKEDYNMKGDSEIDKEWYEQAEAIEEFFLENSPEELNLNDEGHVDGLAGATMVGTSYKNLAIKARDLHDDIFNEFKFDGKFTAFEVSDYYGDPQITWVDVIIKDGQIESFNIDERQTEDGTWNELTKKELKEEYGMKPISPIDKEWYEQAEAIEEFFLNNKPWNIKLNDDNFVDDVDGLAGATMVADSYRDLAIKAMINALRGVYTEFETNYSYGNVQVTWVNAFVDEEGIYKYYIDEIQTENKVWNELSKKELGEEYNMKDDSTIDKEWYEQAYVIEMAFIDSLDNWEFKEDGKIDVELDGEVGSTMVADIYHKLAIDLYERIK